MWVVRFAGAVQALRAVLAQRGCAIGPARWCGAGSRSRGHRRPESAAAAAWQSLRTVRRSPDLNAAPAEIRLGARATEHEVKELSAKGVLAQYRIVHFATHGLLAGQLDPKSEPGLILTPPAKASEDDDGYLSVSEIAALKLDADWVILSACNTAVGGVTGAEALSGSRPRVL